MRAGRGKGKGTVKGQLLLLLETRTGFSEEGVLPLYGVLCRSFLLSPLDSLSQWSWFFPLQSFFSRLFSLDQFYLPKF